MQPHYKTANAKFVPFGQWTTCHHLKTSGTTHWCNPLRMVLATPTPFHGWWWWQHKPCPTPSPKIHFSADDTANDANNCLMMTITMTQLRQQLAPKLLLLWQCCHLHWWLPKDKNNDNCHHLSQPHPTLKYTSEAEERLILVQRGYYNNPVPAYFSTSHRLF